MTDKAEANLEETLRDAVAARLERSDRIGISRFDQRNYNSQTIYEDDADVILAMPEMQELRRLVHDWIKSYVPVPATKTDDEIGRRLGVSPSIVNWAREGL